MNAVIINVDNLLELGVVKQKSVIGPIATANETLLEALDVESLDSCCAFIDSTMEDDSGFFLCREQLMDLLVQTYGQFAQFKNGLHLSM
jgi:hypothetical protein